MPPLTAGGLLLCTPLGVKLQAGGCTVCGISTHDRRQGVGVVAAPSGECVRRRARAAGMSPSEYKPEERGGGMWDAGQQKVP